MSHSADRDARILAFAESLFKAERERRPIDPLTESWPGLDLYEAYRIQQCNIDRRIASGEMLQGHKVGLTAKAMQDLFGVDEPDYGQLLSTMFLEADSALDLSELIEPQIEVEPAFVLGRDLAGPGVSGKDVLEATEYVTICFEIIDSRIRNWRIKLQDTVADNGSSARVILGSRRVKPRDLELGSLDTVLEIDGVGVETGNTSAILGHPADSVAWLANKFAEFGASFSAGHTILPGTCTRSVRIGGHHSTRGWIDGLGELSIRLEGQPTVADER